jgi:4-amino-4-deoxy-L-arabinose transferase-like glycosyltransferase
MVRRKCEALDCPEIMGPAAVSTGAENSKGFGYLVVDVLDHGFTSARLSGSLDGISEWSPGPFWLWFAGGTGGICPCFDIGVSMTFT